MTIQKTFNFIAIATLGFVAISMGYIGYLMFEPFKPPTLTSPIPILNKDKIIHHGQTISTKIEYCVFKAVPSTTSKRYEQVDGDKRVYFLATTQGAGAKVGCGSLTSNTGTIPGDIPPGNYKIILISVFHVNSLKNVTVTYETEKFEIAK